MLRDAEAFWDETEPHVTRFLLKVILYVALLAATPLVGLAILFALLQKPLWWAAIPLGVAILLVAAGLLLWLFVRARLKQARGHLGTAAAAEELLRGP